MTIFVDVSFTTEKYWCISYIKLTGDAQKETLKQAFLTSAEKVYAL